MYETRNYDTLIKPAGIDGTVEAARLLKSGEVVAIPTETVYGLAGNALDPKAIAKIFAAKGRPRDNPLIVHAADMEAVRGLGLEVSPLAVRLAADFWAGPLTMVMKKVGDTVPGEVSCGLGTVAVRVPGCPAALDIIKACGFPLAAPSANVSGAPSPTKAEHVYADLKGRIPLIIDGGECEVGLESTVIALEGDKARILRPGAVTAERLREYCEVVIDEVVYKDFTGGGSAPSPGAAHRHYSPKARVIAVTADSDEAFKAVAAGGCAIADPEARTLFAKLREFDEQGAKRVYIKLPEPNGAGLALYNRIIRAAGFNVVKA
ncbi:MAG: threonylcarbamoyl-AMP synthase [Oscillospiraceae bacterium]|nr:threonylcarbamoyl-AMP synthase [Oscillospiraceae bacterium]